MSAKAVRKTLMKLTHGRRQTFFRKDQKIHNITFFLQARPSLLDPLLQMTMIKLLLTNRKMCLICYVTSIFEVVIF